MRTVHTAHAETSKLYATAQQWATLVRQDELAAHLQTAARVCSFCSGTGYLEMLRHDGITLHAAEH
jgi:hypothetical protein